MYKLNFFYKKLQKIKINITKFKLCITEKEVYINEVLNLKDMFIVIGSDNTYYYMFNPKYMFIPQLITLGRKLIMTQIYFRVNIYKNETNQNICNQIIREFN